MRTLSGDATGPSKVVDTALAVVVSSLSIFGIIGNTTAVSTHYPHLSPLLTAAITHVQFYFDQLLLVHCSGVYKPDIFWACCDYPENNPESGRCHSYAVVLF